MAGDQWNGGDTLQVGFPLVMDVATRENAHILSNSPPRYSSDLQLPPRMTHPSAVRTRHAGIGDRRAGSQGFHRMSIRRDRLKWRTRDVMRSRGQRRVMS